MNITRIFSEDKEWFRLYLQQVVAGRIPHEPPLDENIRTVIEALNDLPFLYTMGSCGGHVRTRESIIVDPRWMGREDLIFSGYAVYTGSWFTFTVDGLQQSELFVLELEKLLRGRPHAYVKQMPQTGPFAYAVVLAYQEEGKESVTKEEAEQLTGQTSELVEKVTELAKVLRRFYGYQLSAGIVSSMRDTFSGILQYLE